MQVVKTPTIILNNTVLIWKRNEMGGACSAYGGEERRIQGIGGET
jgi:hypothetical protein